MTVQNVLTLRLGKSIIELMGVEIERPFFLVTPAILLAGLSYWGHTVISVASKNIPESEVTSSVADSFSATATITITMTGASDE